MAEAVQAAPDEGEAEDDDGEVDGELPAQPDDEHLERHHQQDRVEVVEYREHPRLAEEPGVREPRRGEHREEDSCTGGCGESRYEKRFTPPHTTRKHPDEPRPDE